jgi:O-antigen/teichoic acid export membrane protein
MSRSLYSGHRFRGALAYLLMGRAAQAIATVSVALLAIRAFGSTEYGVYMVLLGLVDLCLPLSSLGLLPTVQQFLPEMALHASAAQLRRFVRVMLVLRVSALVVFATAIYWLWMPIAVWLGIDAAAQAGAWIVCALIVTLLGAMFSETMLEALLEQRFAYVLRVLYAFGRLSGLILLMATDRVSVPNMLAIDIGLSLLRWVCAEWVLTRQLRRLQPDGSRQFVTGDIARFGWHMAGAQLLSAAASPGALRVVVARALGVDAAGYFAFAQQLLKQAMQSMPAMWLANVVRPMLIARFRMGETAVVALSGGLLWKINLASSAALAAAAFVGGNALMASLSGGRIEQGGWVLALVMLAGAGLGQAQVSGTLMQVYRYSSLARSAALFSLVVPVAVFAGAFWSLNVASAGLALGAGFMAVANLLLLQTQTARLKLDVAGLFRVLAAVGLAALAGWIVARWGWVVGVLTFFASYVGALRVLRPLSAQEFQVLQRIAGRPLGMLAWLVRP